MMKGHAVKKPPLGSGDRFAALAAKLGNRPGVTNPAALAASIGRKKYGGPEMAMLAAKGRSRKKTKVTAKHRRVAAMFAKGPVDKLTPGDTGDPTSGRYAARGGK